MARKFGIGVRDILDSSFKPPRMIIALLVDRAVYK